MKLNNLILAIFIFLVVFMVLTILKPNFKNSKTPEPESPPISISPETPPPPPPPPIETPNITTQIPNYLSYPDIIKQLKIWNEEAPRLTEVGVYGKTSRGQDIYFIRVTNEHTDLALNDQGNGIWNVEPKSKVLVTGCIHGNEPHSTATIMAYIGSMLASYGKDDKITSLIQGREIFFVPVVSPDSYPRSRYVDGVDPNRDFENKRSAPIREVQKFFLQHKFDAAWSGHTWGRVFLYPWGKSMTPCPDDAVYREVMDEVAQLCQYRLIRACEMYTSNGLNNPPIRYGMPGWGGGEFRPIYGTEMDWYYGHGAFAVVCEYGTHQRIPSHSEIESEFNRTFKGFLYFLEKAPLAINRPN
ncbi:MAG: hypothetical protein DWQ19_11620 [Crenarchaeota archaeon]|nr:MAG: hypothetical protein DWQ19_11620 [Thermoproteota archaeon]